jgi:hypothetical protein
LGICAYCKKDKKLTREHIIPNFLYEYQKKTEGKFVGWVDKAKKVLPVEGVIKDVCELCNNEALGRLDASASKMLKSSGILSVNYINKTLVLDYEYNFLLRWVLKVSYNSSRASDNFPHRFQKYIPYILGDQIDSPDDVFLLAGLTKPDYIPEHEKKELFDLFPNGNFPINSDGLSHPFYVRVAWMPQFDDDFVIRVLVIGALFLQVIVFVNNIKIGQKRSKVKSWLKSTKGRQIVDEARNKMVVRQLDQVYLETHEFQIERMKMHGAI